MKGWKLWHKLVFIGVMLVAAIWCQDWFIGGAALTMTAIVGHNVWSTDLD